MQPRRAVTLIAAVVFAIGAVLLFMPLSVGTFGQTSCGSAMQPRTADAVIADIMEPSRTGSLERQCDDAISGRKSIAYPLMGAGALVLAYVYLTRKQEPQTTNDPALP